MANAKPLQWTTIRKNPTHHPKMMIRVIYPFNPPLIFKYLL